MNQQREPILDQLINEHREEFDLAVHFGDLLPDWDGFLAPSN